MMAAATSTLPFTERSNPLTQNIDVADCKGIVDILHSCDEEMLAGSFQFPGLQDDSTVRTILGAVDHIAAIMQEPEDHLVVMSGCGTSGRMAFLAATTCNRLLIQSGRKACCVYLIAGGDRALLTSQEAPEDDPLLGASELQQAVTGKKKVFYIGITCGLSAPYVAGQLDYCLQHLETFTPLLMGFNPVQLARDHGIEKWDKTVKDVVVEMEQATKDNKAFILNPVVGPEPITGSTRMKGGSATKILLDTILLLAAQKTVDQCAINEHTVRTFLGAYSQCVESVYSKADDISCLVSNAGKSLQASGHIYYFGLGTAGIMGCIDASECVPTYGSDPTDVRGFVRGGYDTLNNAAGCLDNLGPLYRLSWKNFCDDILGRFNSSDSAIFLLSSPDELGDCTELAEQLKKTGVHVMAVLYNFQPTDAKVMVSFSTVFPQSVLLQMPPVPATGGSTALRAAACRRLGEFALKLVCNSVSTGAHIMVGKVFQNFMVDVQIRNNKLFYRAIRIVQHLSDCSQDTATRAVLSALYDTDDVTSLADINVSQHVERGTKQGKVVPVALLCAALQLSPRQARQQLMVTPVIRHAILAGINK
ncbi:PREDICTED: glucokinase regulatory protein-like isoform X2 [Branchiostoma belcheri]|uniref:Glucokinase regulatory protein-like isoform X1 n=1 Tax=Branchiostoma belcheri TaxID=7741 RepID=A0A6P4YEE6_BRABE|nr:PREDICTED: glucokinase regulatory protein-like isoform X1 [Branchiostoma belcheri]XP_019620439.1 PREDICTED: glucokinase regulatory protein-like isoform X1 [Branchiostoma belcheri]XP_019620440.1 PREDICTED: glucokinase regulatory protein-like isoform X2 [Branchiostoma belcheri]